MATQKMPITDEVAETPQTQDSSAHVTVCQNLIPTKTGNQLVRPGFDHHSDLTSYSGGYWTQLFIYGGFYEMGKVNVGNHLHRLSWDGSEWSTTSMGTIPQNTHNFPFSIAQDGNKWVCAKGAELKCGDLSDTTIDSITTPPVYAAANANIIKVLALDNYFLALRYLGNEMFYTDPATNPDPTVWPVANYFQTFDGEDIALDANIVNHQLVVMSAKRTEIWQNDGVSPFSRASGGTINVGAHYYGGSSIAVKGVLFWLTDQYALAKYGGGSFQLLPNPYAFEMSDGPHYCIPSYVPVYGQDLLIFCFPDVGTYVYNATSERWSKWDHYRSDTASDPFGVTTFGWHTTAGSSIICGTDEGRLVTLNDNSATENLRDNTSRDYTIWGNKTTGYLDYGIGKRKVSDEIRVRLTSATAGTFRLRWTNNPTIAERPDITITTDGTKTFGIVKSIKRCGIYKNRKYNMYMKGARAAFSDVEEDVEVYE